MGHSYAHVHDLPTTMFRFFTVHGPRGRPDMAYSKFTRAILAGDPIDVYDSGEMSRDFTYVGDLARAIRLLIHKPPPLPGPDRPKALPGDSLSPAAPFRMVNIGNSEKVKLTDFIAVSGTSLGRPARPNNMLMQTGDVPATWANVDLLRTLTGYAPQTDVQTGIAQFVAWYRDCYAV
jgi:UDP-glucuronate 4-epimerase